MKIFLSWSGERSKEVAQAFHEWLPSVLQAAKTWFSPEDIKVGKSWRDTVTSALEENNRGLLFLTQENANAAWVMFEAGALSKNIEDSSVCPVLCGITPTDLIGPLSAFQAIRVVEKDDVWKLIKDYNEHLNELRLDESVLLRSFERAWPELDKKVKEILGREVTKSTRKTQDIAEETLALVRQISQELDNNKKSPDSTSAVKCRDAYGYACYLRKWTENLAESDLATFKSAQSRLQTLLSELHEELCGEKLLIQFPRIPMPPQRKSATENRSKIANIDGLIYDWPILMDSFRTNFGTVISSYFNDATPIAMDDDYVTIGFSKSFNHSKAVEAMKRSHFEEKINELLDKPRRLSLILIDEKKSGD